MNPFGSAKYLSRVASSQTTLEVLLLSEYANPETVPAFRPTIPARLGPRRFLSGSMVWHAEQTLRNRDSPSCAAAGPAPGPSAPAAPPRTRAGDGKKNPLPAPASGVKPCEQRPPRTPGNSPP